MQKIRGSNKLTKNASLENVANKFNTGSSNHRKTQIMIHKYHNLKETSRRNHRMTKPNICCTGRSLAISLSITHIDGIVKDVLRE